MPPTLHIRLLGNCSLVYDDETLASINTPRLQSLLAYLVLHSDAPLLRQHLAYLFWPDSSEAQARNNLRQTLHAVRLALPDADAFLQSDSNTLRWRPDAPFQVDVKEFERALDQAEAAEHSLNKEAQRIALERAANLYEADLLPSCYDEWIGPERERLRQRYVQSLTRLIALLEAQHDDAAAVAYAQRLVRHDTLNEDACRRLMHLLALKGDRSGALRAFHACAGALERELGIAPAPETTEIYERLLRMDTGVAPASEQLHLLSASQALIGRQREWERLREVWRRAAAGEPGFVLITGEAGIGKSRLAEELLLWASQHGASTASTRSYAAEGRLSLAPVTDWLRSEGLRPHLARLDTVWLTEISRLLPELASERPDLPRYEPISEYGQRKRFFEALARAVLAAPQPLLLLIDDLQWCDQETLEWLHYLLRFDSSARLLIVGSARTEELSPEHPLRSLLLDLYRTSGVAEIPLQPLDAAETARLAASVSDREIGDSVAMRLYYETEGNPLFVVETMRAGFDSASARRGATDDTADGTRSLNHDVPSLPPRVRAVLAARLAQVSPSARELAAYAAAIGREFQLDVLGAASATKEDDLLRALDELWQRRIMREHGANTYDFTHDKLRDVAYAEISAPQRRMFHRRVAQAFETVYAGNLDSVCGQIASHFERAGMLEQAIPYYQRAAAVAQRVYANEDAIEILVRALELLTLLPPSPVRDAQELRLVLALGPIYRVTRGWTAPELERVVKRSLALCETAGDDAQQAEALYGWESLLVVQAKLDQVSGVATRLQTLYRRSGRAAPFLSDMMAAGVELHLGHFVEANDVFERMVRAHDQAQLADQEDLLGWNLAVHTRAWQAHALWCLGYPDQALRRGQQAIQVARELVMPFNQALASTYFAMLQQLRADVATLKVCAEEACALTAAYKAPYYHTWATVLARYVEAWQRPDPENRGLFRESLEDFTASGARLRFPYYCWLLACACHKAGRIDEGLNALDEAVACAEATGEHWWDAELLRLRGELLWTQGSDDERVEASLLQAAETAREQCARSLELRALTSLARWRVAKGNPDDACRRLADVYGWFTEGFDTPDLRAARTLLAGRP